MTFSGSLAKAATVQPPVPVARSSGVGPGSSAISHLAQTSGGHRLLELEVLPVAAEEHRGGARLRRGVEIVVGLDRRHPLRRGAAVDQALEVVQGLQHLLLVLAFAEDRLAFRVDELAALGPEVRQPVEGGALPAAAVEEHAVDAGLRRLERGRLQLVPGLRHGLHDVGVVVEHPQVGAPPPGVDMPVRAGDALADEREEVVELLLGEELVEWLQHAVLDEERELERVDRHAVGRAAGAGLLQQARVLGADVLAEELEVDLPVGMRLGPLLPGGGIQRTHLLVRAVGRLVGVEPHRQGVRRVGLADVIGGHQSLRQRPGGHAHQHRGREQSDSNRSEHLSLLPFAAAVSSRFPKRRPGGVAQRS